MFLYPVKGLFGPMDLLGRGYRLEEVILEIGIRGIRGLLSLKDKTRVLETLNLCNMGFFFGFTADILFE
jgi:hypothetical protein